MNEAEATDYEIRYFARVNTYLFFKHLITFTARSSVASPEARVFAYIRSGREDDDPGFRIAEDVLPPLLDLLSNLRQHTDLLSPLDSKSIRPTVTRVSEDLYAELGSIKVSVTRSEGIFSGSKNMAKIWMGDIVIEHSLDDKFFEAITHLKSLMDQLQRLVEDKVRAHIGTTDRRA